MERLISIILVVVMMLGCIGFVACGGGDGGTTPPSNSETAPPSNGDTAPPSGVGLTWNDMPVYPGANQIQKGTWTIPPTEGEYREIEWRHYETGDSLSAVTDYYKSKMPGKGWQDIGWFETPDMHMGNYSKNNEQDVAVVTVTSLIEGGTLIALMRATQ